MHLLDFSFLAILNLFVIVLWPATGYYTGSRPASAEARRDVLGIIMLILTIIAVVLDIVFMALALLGR